MCPGVSLGTEDSWNGVAFFCGGKYCCTTKQQGLYSLPIGNTPSNALIPEPGIGMVSVCPSAVCMQSVHSDVFFSGQKDPAHVSLTSSTLTSCAV